MFRSLPYSKVYRRCARMATDGNFRMSQGDRRVGLQALACFDEDSDYACRGDGAARTHGG